MFTIYYHFRVIYYIFGHYCYYEFLLKILILTLKDNKKLFFKRLLLL
jgi:hypothetical protein